MVADWAQTVGTQIVDVVQVTERVDVEDRGLVGQHGEHPQRGTRREQHQQRPMRPQPPPRAGGQWCAGLRDAEVGGRQQVGHRSGVHASVVTVLITVSATVKSFHTAASPSASDTDGQ